MYHRNVFAFASAILLIALTTALHADEVTSNWHQWRGPSGNGVSPTANPPTEWGADKNIAWKVAIPGHGSSSPVVWGERVFVLSAEKLGEGDSAAAAEEDRSGRERDRSAPKEPFRFLVHCLNRATGETIWQKTAIEAVPHEGHHQHHGYSSPSPTTDGKRIIASFGSRGIFAYDMEGKKLWERDLGDMKTRNSFGEGSSPVLHGDLVFIQWDHEEECKFYALDANTGEIKWSQDRDEISSWSTPLVVEHGGVTQVIANATNRVRSYNAATGDVLWSCAGQTVNVIPSPSAADGVVYCFSGFRGAAAYAIKLDARGELAEGDPNIVWKHGDSTPYVPTQLLYDGLIYFFGGYKNVMSIMDAKTGKVLTGPQRMDQMGDVYASPVGAAGRVYIVDREGMVFVLAHGAEVKVLAINEMDEPIDASPALAGNQLFLRGTKTLYCILEKQ